jgi:hypothetical protein
MSNEFRFHSRVGCVLQGCHDRGERYDGETYFETLESSAKSSAASPYTFSPLFSLSISNPPSYFPMSMVGGLATGLVVDGGAVVLFSALV